MTRSLPLYAPKASPSEAFDAAVADLRDICPLPAHITDIFDKTANSVHVDTPLPAADWKSIPRHGRIWCTDPSEPTVLYHKKSNAALSVVSEKMLSDTTARAGFPVASPLLGRSADGGKIYLYSPYPDASAMPLRDQLGIGSIKAPPVHSLMQNDRNFAASYLALWVSDVWTGNYDRHHDNIVAVPSPSAQAPDKTFYYGFDVDITAQNEEEHKRLLSEWGQKDLLQSAKNANPHHYRDVMECALRVIENHPDDLILERHKETKAFLSEEERSKITASFDRIGEQLIRNKQAVRPFIQKHGLV